MFTETLLHTGDNCLISSICFPIHVAYPRPKNKKQNRIGAFMWLACIWVDRYDKRVNNYSVVSCFLLSSIESKDRYLPPQLTVAIFVKRKKKGSLHLLSLLWKSEAIGEPKVAREWTIKSWAVEPD